MDISEDLLSSIRTDFEKSYNENEQVQICFERLTEGTATYQDAAVFSNSVGNMLSEAYLANITAENLPNETLYYNICKKVLEPTLTENFDRVTSYTANVQTGLNKALGMGLKGIKAKLDKNMIVNLIDKITDSPLLSDILWLFDAPVKNFVDSTVDKTLKANIDFQARSGLEPIIKRTAEIGECAWCSKLEGTYRYSETPADVYRRHDRCRCVVEYIGEGRNELVHGNQVGKMRKKSRA